MKLASSGADRQEGGIDERRGLQIPLEEDPARDGEQRDQEHDERVVLMEDLREDLEADRPLVQQVREDGQGAEGADDALVQVGLPPPAVDQRDNRDTEQDQHEGRNGPERQTGAERLLQVGRRVRGGRGRWSGSAHARLRLCPRHGRREQRETPQ